MTPGQGPQTIFGVSIVLSFYLDPACPDPVVCLESLGFRMPPLVCQAASPAEAQAPPHLRPRSPAQAEGQTDRAQTDRVQTEKVRVQTDRFQTERVRVQTDRV